MRDSEGQAETSGGSGLSGIGTNYDKTANDQFRLGMSSSEASTSDQSRKGMCIVRLSITKER